MSRRRKAKSFDQRFTGHVTARRVAKLAKSARPCARCNGKMLHRTRASAGKHLHRLAGVDGAAALHLQVYPCPHQDGFHVGHGQHDDPALPTKAALRERAKSEAAS